MAPTHKQIFWDIGAGTGDIGPEKRAQIAKAALMLQQNPVVIHSSSAGGYNESEAPEIALAVPVDFAQPQDLTTEIDTALANEGLSDAPVTFKSKVSWLALNEAQLEDLNAVTVVNDMSVARASIDDLVRVNHVPPSDIEDTPNTFAAELAKLLSETNDESIVIKAIETEASRIPAKELAEAMLLTEEKYKRMRNAKRLEVEDEIIALKDALLEVSKTTDTNTGVLAMIIGGIVSVGGVMIKAYKAYQAVGSLSAMISAAIASAGGIAAVAAIAAAVAAVILALFVVLKDAVNLIVVINGSKHDIDFTNDAILNGERYKVTLNVPSAQKEPKKPFAYGCGFYTYRKWRIGDVPFGTFGSCAGAAFKASNGTRFCVGADCPNTVLGGENCFRVRQGSDAMAVAKLARDSRWNQETFDADGHRCTMRRSYMVGSVNFGICSFEPL
ncbi:hypothetical protein QBC38DRAFT_490162 [Podospora fimiseda]|uniref:Uncharacterized protein n=1 Tax=Podospora fimiseda TaxID=252190 RepID=A0AAN6YQN5_9PEZI|nr:hypothetical protein QBC38DRAFT_490162 [Podospora fimiseda]